MNTHRPPPHKRRCPCGQPAVEWLTGGYVCAGCKRIELQRDEPRPTQPDRWWREHPEPYRVVLT